MDDANDRASEGPEIRSKHRSNSMDHFLSTVRKDRSVVDLFFQNGKRLTGTIIECDSFSILVSCGGETSLVYKSAISCVSKFSRRPRKDERAMHEGQPYISRAGQRPFPSVKQS